MNRQLVFEANEHIGILYLESFKWRTNHLGFDFTTCDPLPDCSVC